MNDNVLDDLENKVDTCKRILYKVETEYLDRLRKELDALEKYIQSIKELK